MSDEIIRLDHNLPVVAKELQNLIRKAGSMAPAWKAMGQALELSTDKRFESETGPDGKKWKALKKATLKKKERKGKPLKILLQDNMLRFTIDSKVDGNTLLIGSPQKYGAIHQLGGPAGRKDRRFIMQARPFLGVSKGDEEECIAIIGDYLLM